MKIQPIIEGHGEVEAFPVLLRRLQDAAQAYQIGIGRPIRIKRSQITKRKPLIDCRATGPNARSVSGMMIILFDADDDCPKETIYDLQEWASQAAGNIPCRVVMANREYEAGSCRGRVPRGKRYIRRDAVYEDVPNK